MSLTGTAKGFGRRVSLETAAFFLAAFGLFVLAGRYALPFLPEPLVYFIGFNLSALGLAKFVDWRMTTFRCRQCARPLPEYVNTEEKPGVDITYYCENCDTIWRIGLRTNDD